MVLIWSFCRKCSVCCRKCSAHISLLQLSSLLRTHFHLLVLTGWLTDSLALYFSVCVCVSMRARAKQNKRAKAREKLHCSGLIMLIERIDDGDMRTVFMCTFISSMYGYAGKMCGSDGDRQQIYIIVE